MYVLVALTCYFVIIYLFVFFILFLFFFCIILFCFFFFFFFSSRRRHTRFDCDWSSDVCSSDLPASSPVTALAGKVAGARISVGTGAPGAPPAIRLRGSTNLGIGGSSPLIIVDGVVTRTNIADLDASDIESIEILKGATASSYYGSNAANGVISITTKRGRNLPEGNAQIISRSEYGKASLQNWVPLNTSHPYLLNPDGSILDR